MQLAAACLTTALIVIVTRAQNIDNKAVTVTAAEHKNKDNGLILSNNASLNDDTSGSQQSSESSEGTLEENGIQIAVPMQPVSFSSDSSATSSRQTRETSESNYGSNDTPDETPDSQNASPENNTVLGETTSDSPYNGTTENGISKESQVVGTAEIFSLETPESQGENNTIPPVEASIEGEGGQIGQVTITDEVQTSHGPVKGFQWQDKTEIVAFYDIPYGTYERPFATSVTAQSWLGIGVHEATHHTKICPQMEEDKYIGEENCLTLSIFTPKNADNASVLFHIYDNHSNCKSADPDIYGPDYLVSKGVILVLPNYRIGPMGFLCMLNDTAPGNAGLKDLSLALEWVKDNIEFFGGNPENIVVSGDGAAGAYAGYLALCSPTKRYISKVITESGSTLSHWALDRDPVGTARELADILREHHADGVIYNNTFDETALATVLKAAKGMRFMPCIEADKEPLLDDTPWKILQNKDINATFMIGFATYAGTHEATETTGEFVEEINKHFNLLLPEDLVFKSDEERDRFSLQLREQYFGKDNITVKHVDELSLWYTDASYLSPGIRLARPLAAAGAAVYLYEFAYVGGFNWALEALKKPVQGAVRGDLVGYLFRKNGSTVTDDSPEKRMIDLMVALWVSFIDTGKPTASDIDWHELKTGQDEEEEWLYISSEPKLKKGIHVERLRLWTSLYDRHFIDNSAVIPDASACLTFALLICLIANNKVNYGRQ